MQAPSYKHRDESPKFKLTGDRRDDRSIREDRKRSRFRQRLGISLVSRRTFYKERRNAKPGEENVVCKPTRQNAVTEEAVPTGQKEEIEF